MQGNQQVTIPQAMDIAVAHHRAGRLRDAEGIYRQILQRNANFAPAVHMLGVTLFQTGKRRKALPSFAGQSSCNRIIPKRWPISATSCARPGY